MLRSGRTPYTPEKSPAKTRTNKGRQEVTILLISTRFWKIEEIVNCAGKQSSKYYIWPESAHGTCSQKPSQHIFPKALPLHSAVDHLVGIQRFSPLSIDNVL